MCLPPFAQGYHYESKSRGLDTEGENKQRFEREADNLRRRHRGYLPRVTRSTTPTLPCSMKILGTDKEPYADQQPQKDMHKELQRKRNRALVAYFGDFVRQQGLGAAVGRTAKY